MISSPTRIIPPALLFLLLFSAFFNYKTWQQRHLACLDRNIQAQQDQYGRPTEKRLPFYPGTPKPLGSNYSRVLVLPKMKADNVGWVSKRLTGLQTAIYEVENPSAEFTIPKNKGHEAMVYLTFIIDHYDNLPDTSIFVHAHQTAWHNNYLLNLDMASTIEHLKDDRVARQGYMNLRCHLDSGIRLDRATVDIDDADKPEERYFSFEVFQAMFPGHRPPPYVSQACCAQFAVSRERIRDNPQDMYVHLRKWLLSTTLDDRTSGRIFEYTWQYLFTRYAVFHPAMNSCYCDGYGICFGNAKKLDEWLQKKVLRDRTNEDLDGAHIEKNEQKIKELSQRVWQLNKELKDELAEAYRRGEEEENRALERERPQEYF